MPGMVKSTVNPYVAVFVDNGIFGGRFVAPEFVAAGLAEAVIFCGAVRHHILCASTISASRLPVGQDLVSDSECTCLNPISTGCGNLVIRCHADRFSRGKLDFKDRFYALKNAVNYFIEMEFAIDE